MLKWSGLVWVRKSSTVKKGYGLGNYVWKLSNGSRWCCLLLDPDFCYGCSIVSLLPCSYHWFMVSWYISKREKFQMAKKRSTEECRPVRELERVMDMELFLELQSSWPEDSPHCLVILHEMFWHAAIEGQKEAEQTIHWGCQPHMPQLDLEVGIPAIQLVGPQTTKEELLDMYLEVYNIHRQPGSPPSELAIWEEIMAKVPDNPCSGENQRHEATAQSHTRGSHSSRSRTPCRRNNDPVGQTLAMVQEAHQKALSTISTLEREIERLHCTQAWSQLRARSKSRDRRRLSGEGWKRRCHQVRFADNPAPSQSANLKMPLGEEGSQGRGSDLGKLPELKLTVASFLWGRRGWEDASRARYYGLWPLGPVEGREVWDSRLVGGTISSTGEHGHEKTSQGGQGIFPTSTATAGIGHKGGYSLGSPCTTLSP